MPNFQHNIIQNGNFLAIIDGSKCRNIQSFYKEIAMSLNFPDYFSNNLDSFDEMISDLEWIEEKVITLIIINAGDLLADDKDKLPTINGIFFRAAVELENFKIQFSVHTQKL